MGRSLALARLVAHSRLVMTLDHLDFDTLTLIISTVCKMYPRPRFALLPISLVSRRLRTVTLNWIFRTYKWTLDLEPPITGGYVVLHRSLAARIKGHMR